MKKIFIVLAMAMTTIALSNAKTLNVEVGNVTYTFPVEQTGEMTYTDATNITILGKTLFLGDISRMFVDDTQVEDNTVTVKYNGEQAFVTVAGNIAQYIEPTIDGGHVSIVQSLLVNETTCGEITYTLSGESSDGQFYFEGDYKSTVVFNGLTLTNLSGAPIDIQNGKRIKIDVADGTENSLTDCSGGSQKGCFSCKGHPEFKGSGTLNVYCNTGHAIYAKEYIEIKKCTINVYSAKKDGLNCNQYLLIESGALNISGVGDDGVQVSFKDDTDREEEDTGSITITGGTFNVSATATASKAIKADGDINISGGKFTLSTSGGGKWDEEDVKTKGASCLNADGSITISGGEFVMTSTGSAGKGISCDVNLTISDGVIEISTSGKVFAYINGSEYDNYTGNTDNIDSDYKSSPKGIKADGNILISGGTITVTTTGNGGEGIESKSEMTIDGGTIVVNSYDDGLNSSSHMYLNGGDLTVVATNNDAIDSNGNMYITGGTIRAFGASAPETGLDANGEEGYKVYITGGSILAVGGSANSSPSTSGERQYYVTGSGSPQANNVVKLSSGSTEMVSFTVPSSYSGSGFASGGGKRPGGGGSSGNVLVSCAGMTKGTSYTLTIGSSTSSVTAK